MEAVRRKEEAAFTELYARYGKRLLHFAYRLLNHDEALAQDVLQEVFVRLAERPEMFDTTRNFKSWIFTVVANECRKTYRHGTTEQLDDLAERQDLHPVDELIAPVDRKIFNRHLKQALLTLSSEHRETFVLRYQEQFSLKEIAVVMECSEGTVKSRLYYATKKLAGHLEAFKPLYQK